MPNKRPVRSRNRSPELALNVVMATWRSKHHRRLPLHGTRKRVVGRGVACVECQHQVWCWIDGRSTDRALDESHRARPAERLRDLGVALSGRGLDVYTDKRRVDTLPFEPPVRREAEVRVTAAEVGDSYGLPAGRLTRGVDDRVESSDELFDLAVLVAAGRLDVAGSVGDPHRLQHGVCRIEEPLLRAVMGSIDKAGGSVPVYLGFTTLGDPDLGSAADRLHMPIAVRLGQEFLHGAGGSRSRQVASEGLPLVVRHDLKPAAITDVDPAKLSAPEIGPCTLPAPRGDGSDEPVRVQNVRSKLVHDGREWLRHLSIVG